MNNLFANDIIGCGGGRQPRSRKPLILGHERYRKILDSMNEVDGNAKYQEEENKIREQLHIDSQEIISKWPNYVSDYTAKEIVSRKKALDDKMQAHHFEYQKIKENDERIRLEKIRNAQNFIQKVKSGPKVLESAAMHCECIQNSKVYEKIREDYHKLVRDQEIKGDKKYTTTTLQWMKPDEKRQITSKIALNQYKRDLYQTVKDNEIQKNKCKNHCLEIEKSALEHGRAYNKAQNAKEQELIKKKHENHRKNSIDGIKCLEQRKLREKCEDDLDCKVIALTLTNQHKINCIKNHKEKQAQKAYEAFMNGNYKQLENIIESHESEKNNKNEEQYKKDFLRDDRKFKEREQAYIDKLKKNRLDRAQEMSDLIKIDTQKMNQKTEDYRYDIANKLKNIEINEEFIKMEKLEKTKKREALTHVLDFQIKEKQRIAKEEADWELKCNKIDNSKEDEFYFEYAKDLIKNAAQKNRITLPIERVVAKHKKKNGIDIRKPTPRHLKSSIENTTYTGSKECCPELFSNSI